MSETKRETERMIVLTIIAHEKQKGRKLSEIFRELLDDGVFDDQDQRIKMSLKTLYRWWREYLGSCLETNTSISTGRHERGTSLPRSFTEFLVQRKKEDPEASIPEIIRQAVFKELVAEGEVNRTTAYRFAKKKGLPLLRQQGKRYDNMRRFAFSSRMMMVLVDGKHFRVGIKGRKRVALVFEDDACRYVLYSVVGPSESAHLFARGLFEVVSRYGNDFSLFLDNGSGFIAEEIRRICESVGIRLIHGSARYPEGRGKIERLNRTFQSDLLRSFRGNPSISSENADLEDRINHYFREVYNKRPHSALNGETPYQRWSSDPKPLSFVSDIPKLREKFYAFYERKVSRDNVVSIDGKYLETPSGHAGRYLKIRKNILLNRYELISEKGAELLTEVDPQSNSYIRRKKQAVENPRNPVRETHATMAYEAQASPDLVDADNNCKIP